MRKVETAIIGSGPYGLSLAAHLQHRGLPYVMFGRPMQLWRDFMPEGMWLKSEPFASSLSDPARAYTLEAYCREKSIPYQPTANPVPRAIFLDYAAWFQAKTGVASNGLFVKSVDRTADGFVVTADNGEQLAAQRVVLATGQMPFVQVPDELKALPAEQMMHSAYLPELGRFAGRRVAIVGAGQSALESAALLIEAGAKVTVISRRGFIWNPPAEAHRSLWQILRAPESTLAPGWRSLFYAEMPYAYRYLPQSYRHRVVATKWGPSGSAWLHDRIVGKAELLEERTILAATSAADGVNLTLRGPQGVETLAADVVVAATGYKGDVERLTMLSPQLRSEIAREGRMPRLNGEFETSVPNLFVTGMLSAPTFGPVMRFMAGTKHAAPMLAAALAKRSSRQQAQATPLQLGARRAIEPAE